MHEEHLRARLVIKKTKQKKTLAVVSLLGMHLSDVTHCVPLSRALPKSCSEATESHTQAGEAGVTWSAVDDGFSTSSNTTEISSSLFKDELSTTEHGVSWPSETLQQLGHER